MKTSVLIVAHNEENHIKNCIQSVLRQTLTPDEIVIICHNCTDKTIPLARSFTSVKVIDYKGPKGVPYARIKGFEEVTGDIVVCLDGDGTVNKTWLRNLVDPLSDDKHISLVAGYVILTNGIFARITSFWQFVILRKMFRKKLNCFAWGSNFACRKADYEKVGGIKPLIELRDKIGLNFWAEDLYISLTLMQIGKIYFSLRAKSYTQIPDRKINLKTAPIKKWREDNQALLKYFKR